MVSVKPGGWGPHRVAPYHRCWPICFCIMPLIIGWFGPIPTYRSVVILMMDFSTVGQSQKLSVCVSNWKSAFGKEVSLELHPNKTRVVYCKDSRRTGTHENVKFDFLGYCFRPRRVVTRHRRVTTGFTPAVSCRSMTAMRQSLRKMRLQLQSSLSLDDLARLTAPKVRGWMAYYCLFRGSEFQPVAEYIDHLIVRWAMRKFKRLRGHKNRAYAWLDRVKRKSPSMFVHWCGRGDFVVGAMGAR